MLQLKYDDSKDTRTVQNYDIDTGRLTGFSMWIPVTEGVLDIVRPDKDTPYSCVLTAKDDEDEAYGRIQSKTVENMSPVDLTVRSQDLEEWKNQMSGAGYTVSVNEKSGQLEIKINGTTQATIYFPTTIDFRGAIKMEENLIKSETDAACKRVSEFVRANIATIDIN